MRLVSVLLAVALIAGIAWAVGQTTGELTSANAQREETSFGDLTADALAAAAQTTIAFVPALSFKSGTIPPGPVTEPAVRELLTLPTETWAVVSLTGAQMREALERSVSRAPQPNAGFLQVSGLTVTYNPNGPRNARITGLMASGVTVVPDQVYQVAMPQSLAKGGSGYFTIFGEGDITRSGADEMSALIVRYVDLQRAVSYTGQGRIIIAG